MALIKCPECGREISDKALCCPHCGYTMQNEIKTTDKSYTKVSQYEDKEKPEWIKQLKKKVYYLVLAPIIIFLIILLILLILYFSDPDPIDIYLGVGMSAWFCFLFAIAIAAANSYKIFKVGNCFLAFKYVGGDIKCYLDGNEISADDSDNFRISPSLYVKPCERCSFLLINDEPIVEEKEKRKFHSPFININITNEKTAEKTFKNRETTDIEKKLIKNNQIDLLASMNPDNVKDMKEKIDLINELDDLNGN